MHAVITADIIDYTRLSSEDANVVLGAIHKLFEKINAVKLNLDSNFSIKRGDNIQGVIDNPAEALNVALLLKTAINKIDLLNNTRGAPPVDVRIAIGVGDIEVKRERVDESSGDAYTFSGRTLDSMKKNKRLIEIKTANKKINEELDTELKLLEVIISGWKVTSAEVLYWTLLGYNEKAVELELGISQPAINQRKKTAGWSGIEALLNRYKQLMERY